MSKKTKNRLDTPNKATKGFRAYCAVVITIALITVLSAAAFAADDPIAVVNNLCLLYTSPSPRDRQKSRMPSSA